MSAAQHNNAPCSLLHDLSVNAPPLQLYLPWAEACPAFVCLILDSGATASSTALALQELGVLTFVTEPYKANRQRYATAYDADIITAMQKSILHAFSSTARFCPGLPVVVIATGNILHCALALLRVPRTITENIVNVINLWPGDTSRIVARLQDFHDTLPFADDRQAGK